ncbi:hypothetical protein [Pradoshia sp.]|uniref:hypothetical protein n=1 Tax=Pradoshia sp. TaxID=2651281 RepID=UPI003EFBB8E6
MALKKIHHTQKGRIWLNWAGRIVMYLATSTVVLASFLLFWFAYLSYVSEFTAGAIALSIGAIILFILGIFFIRMVTRIPREDYGIEMKEDGIYQYFVNFDRQETKEHFLSYDQIERIIIGPSAFKIARKPYYYITVRFVWEWTEDGKKGYSSISVETKKQLEEMLDKFSPDTPIQTTDYDLSSYNAYVLHEIFSTTELNDWNNRDPLVLPFTAFQRQYSPGRRWEPAAIREKRQRRYARLDKYGAFFYRMSLIYCLLCSLLFIPGWPVNSNEHFDNNVMVVFPIPLMLPLIIFYYFRERFSMKQVLLQWVYLLVAYFAGAFIGAIFRGINVAILLAIIDYGKNLLITLFITFLISKSIWFFCFAAVMLTRLFKVELMKPNPRKQKMTLP